jgi:hypothetical protein
MPEHESGCAAPPLTLVKTISDATVEGSKVSVPFVVEGLPQDDGEFEFVFIAKVPSADLSRESQPMAATLKRDTHVISAQMNAIGGTPLANQTVEVVDPDSDEVVARVETDENGRLVAVVPEKKSYDLRIVDDDPGEGVNVPHEFDPELERGEGHLFLQVVDGAGSPLAGRRFRVSGEHGSFEVASDAQGKIEALAPHGVYRLEAGGRAFAVHTLYADDLAADPSPYRLVVG